MRWVIGVLVVLGLVAGGYAVGIAIGDEEDDAEPASQSTSTTGGADASEVPDGFYVVDASEGTYENGTLTLSVGEFITFVSGGQADVVDTEEALVDLPGLAVLVVPEEDEKVVLDLARPTLDSNRLSFAARHVPNVPRGLLGVTQESDEPPGTFERATLLVAD